MNTFKIITDPIQRTVIYYPENIKLSPAWSYPLLFIFVTKDFHPEELRQLKKVLSRTESERSQRFRFRNDRDSYIIVHGLLRMMLSTFLGIPAAALDIRYNEFGKPYLPGENAGVFFNLSHSSGVSVLAFSRGSEIGVDVEKINPAFDYLPVAERFFTPSELRYIRREKAFPYERFFEIWTRKEAFLKAIGVGITEHLDVEVSENRNTFQLNGETAGMTFSSNEFMLNTLTFQQKYIITLAVNPAFGRIDAFIPGKKGNARFIPEAVLTPPDLAI
ncbi:MAG TPA: 4'-phosphopantetheinyl transferase superfamily protein [Bacteroidales bacterium]|nr:4'-phosphopantetheinyl transferase superfamily protein [Bacteroidales bacterium]